MSSFFISLFTFLSFEPAVKQPKIFVTPETSRAIPRTIIAVSPKIRGSKRRSIPTRVVTAAEIQLTFRTPLTLDVQV